MADGDVYKTTLEWRYTALDVAVNNVLWFRQENDADPDVIPEIELGERLAAALPGGSTDWPGQFRLWLDQNYSLNNIRVQRVYPVVNMAYVTPVNLAGRATNGPTYIPSTAAILVRLTSTLNTRRGRGRLYLGGIAPLNPFAVQYSLANSGYWGALVRAAAAGFIDGLQVAAAPPAVGALYHLGVWSREIAGPTPPYSNGFNPLLSREVTSAVRVQRRREVGVGI